MGKQELAAVEALARHFSARWDVGEGPHEAWLTIARKRVAVDVEHPPEERIVERARANPGVRDRDQLDLVPSQPQLVGKLIRDDLRPSVCVRNLGPAHGNSHRCWSCSSRAIRSSRSSISFSIASLNAR